MKTTAVVVTYNRLDKLRLCMNALLSQSAPLHEIVVVNNHSTDGTAAYLDKMEREHAMVHHYELPENVGGAGGFEKGVGIAVERGAEYVWIMDDDTLPQPTALRELLGAFKTFDNVGFACSRVNWTDGNLHNMNKPWFIAHPANNRIVETITEPVTCERASFVSIMVPGKVVRKIGLPIGEYFIWGDDTEYTARIIRAGYRGVYVPASVVTHLTASNIGASIADAPVASAKRFYYQMRNVMANKRMNTNAVAAFVSSLFLLRRTLRRIRRRSDHQQEFREQVMKGFRDGLRFRPAIKFPSSAK